MATRAAYLNQALSEAENNYRNSRLPNQLGVPIGQPVASSSPLQNLVNNFNSMETSDPWYKFYSSFYCSRVSQLDKEYKQIIAPFAGNNSDLPGNIVTQKNAELLTDISGLQTKLEDLKSNQAVSQIRNDTLRSGNGAVSNHQIYLLGRPLRPASIPFLWALSVLFIGIGVLIFYMFFPYTSPPFEIFVFDLYLLFSNPYTWGILFGISSVVILFLTLRLTGYL
jgi:hypothetical protein